MTSELRVGRLLCVFCTRYQNTDFDQPEHKAKLSHEVIGGAAGWLSHQLEYVCCVLIRSASL